MKYDKIIFVCTGNTCRSPMAEMIMKQKLSEAGISPMPSVISRGINAYNGTPISRQASEVLALHGLSHNGFISLQIREQDLTGGRVLVLTMTERHAEAVRAMFHIGQQGRSSAHAGVLFGGSGSRSGDGAKGCEVCTLAEYAGEVHDVADPFGQPVSVYEECFEQMERLIDKVVRRIGQAGQR